MHHEDSSPGPSRAWGGAFMAGPGRAWGGAFMAFTEASCPVPSRAWRGGFKVFLFGALVLYNMHHEGSSPGPSRAWEEPSWHFPSSRAWKGGFMVFLFAALCYTICIMKARQGAHATHGSGLALINCIVADHSQL